MGLDRILLDERSPTSSSTLPFLQQGLQNPFPCYWITSNGHPIIEPVRFPCNSFSFFLSCSSCLSMFPNATNRFNGTWAYSR